VPYTESYESALLRGDQDPLPWVLHDEIAAVLSPADRLLDIGCGTAFKTVRLAPLASQVVGVEPNSRMLAKATANIRSATATTNMAAVAGRAEQLPFRNNSFDVVTVMLAPHDAREVSRVLRPGGCAVLEKLGDQDKANIKAAFGTDAHGLRGQFSNLAPGERVHLLQRELSAWFARVEVRVGTWATYYTLDGLLMLLEQTPTVRAFDRGTDTDAIAKLQEDHLDERGIKTIQERILVHAWK
jgi:ubiquinone/menaquinone biosynthesis C-methylase UbiE